MASPRLIRVGLKESEGGKPENVVGSLSRAKFSFCDLQREVLRLSPRRCGDRHHLAIPEGLCDTALERKLHTSAGDNPPRSKVLLRRREVALLREEYRRVHADGYGHSWLSDLHVEWHDATMATTQHTRAAGEKLFVDFAGNTVPEFDGPTGEVRVVNIFVALIASSYYTFAQARFSEAPPD